MKDYYNLFIEYSNQLCSKDDYVNKQKVKVHNIAMKNLIQIQREIANDIKNGAVVLIKLLEYDNEKVRLNAASQCLQIGIQQEKAIEVLRKIERNSTDKLCQFDAQMILKDIH